MLSNIVTSNNLQNLSYGYDKFGNLASRKDNLRNLEETFHYDKMNRLTDIYLGTTHSQIVYDPLGRMTTKQADGETVFANAAFAAAQGQPARPHAMTSAETVEGVFPSATQEIAYTALDKVKTISEGGNTLAYTYGYDQQRIRMVENVGDITRTKDYVGVCEYITEDNGENTTEKTLTYLVGPYGVFAVVEQQDNEEAIHYILKDHLGSWTTITDSEGNVEQELSFDAWGNLRDPDTWTGYTVPELVEAPMFDRGYTGHEHMTVFGLINMNGRMYDPFTSGFLSVDNYVQSPDYTQSFNRYAYCLNNPLKYTDPDGEFFILDAWLSGFFQGFFSTDQNRLSNGWKRANQLAKNDAKILGGLIRPDFNKGFFGRNWDVFSRLTWEFPQTKVGLTFALFSNLCGQVDNVEYYDGVTVSSGNNFGISGAVTLGNYINGSSSLSASADNPLFQHEYGHYLQSKATGPLYLSRYAIPSGLNCLGKKASSHKFHPVEIDANIRAYKYFNNKYDGFSDWDFERHPILGYESTLPITDPTNQAALKNGLLQPAWYDYVFALSPTVGGLTIPATDGLINPRVDGLINPMAGGVLKIITAGLFNWWMLEDYEEP